MEREGERQRQTDRETENGGETNTEPDRETEGGLPCSET